MTSDFDFLRRLYNAFDPFQPLPVGDSAYVDCNAVRGDGDILQAVGREILLSARKTCQLYAGHRGAGKSTELLRLQKHLNDQGFFVVYFAAEEEDIDPEDVQYTDILLACTKNILAAFKNLDSQPVLYWLKERWEDLKDLLQTQISFEELSLEVQVSQFAKITTKMRSEPNERRKIREKINPHTTTLTEALNKFIQNAKKNLPPGYSDLVLIADNLDRIVPIIQPDGRSNHDQIFIDRQNQLKALDCHLVYTVPISLLYSDRATSLTEIYGTPQVLPMIMVRTPDNQPYQPGIDKVIEILKKRLEKVDPSRDIVNLFESQDSLNQLCLMSGGHARNLLLLMKQALEYTKTLPISTIALQRSISELRNTYKDTIHANQWEALANVFRTKEIVNNELYRNLLFNRPILEYHSQNEEGEIERWYDIHPLIRGIKEFQNTYNQLYPG
ncbi:MAG: pilus assembly protein PilB [Anabaena sp. CRKS33]|nr:MAG: pilus assembly protein PilB [Anabaena sp. CRKS33]